VSFFDGPVAQAGFSVGDVVALTAIIVPAIFFAGLLIILVLVVISVVTGRPLSLAIKDWKIDFPTRASAAPDGQAPRDVIKYRAAMEVHADLSQALVAIMEASSRTEAGRRAREWFQKFSSGLGHALTLGSTETYRVTPWIDLPEEGELRALGHHLTNTARLPRQGGVIAAHVVMQAREYYCRDNRNDAVYVATDGRPKDYRSVFCVPLGAEGEPWGSITVDAKAANGFTETDMEIVRSFAGLASAAGAAWVIEREEHEAKEIGPNTSAGEV
jgi:hypothetical protein